MKLSNFIEQYLPIIVSVTPILFGAVFFIAKLDAKIQSVDSGLVELQHAFETYKDNQRDIDDKQTRIFFEYQKLLLMKDKNCRVMDL